MKGKSKMQEKRGTRGVTLIALVVTMIVPYDKNLKHSNINRFHYLQYIKNNKKIENIIKMSLKTCLFLYLKKKNGVKQVGSKNNTKIAFSI